MYVCDSCGLLVGPRIRSHRRVVETAPVSYPYRARAHPRRQLPKTRWPDDPGGEGTRIVREITCCTDCARS